MALTFFHVKLFTLDDFVFQVLLFNISNSTYQLFRRNTNNLQTAAWFQITINNIPQ